MKWWRPPNTQMPRELAFFVTMTATTLILMMMMRTTMTPNGDYDYHKGGKRIRISRILPNRVLCSLVHREKERTKCLNVRMREYLCYVWGWKWEIACKQLHGKKRTRQSCKALKKNICVKCLFVGVSICVRMDSWVGFTSYSTCCITMSFDKNRK